MVICKILSFLVLELAAIDMIPSTFFIIADYYFSA